MKNPLVSIIIVNWNGEDYLKGLLPSLKKNNYRNFEIIVVDNGSDDGSLEFLIKNYPQTKIIKNSKNLGFAKANNQGIKKAKGELVLFLNNDTLVTKNFLTILVNNLTSDPIIGACQPKILSLEKKGRLDSIGSFLTKTGFLYHLGFEARDSKKLDKEIKLFSGKGSCLLFKKEVLTKIGYFDEDFFAYFEETDLCWRLWLAGYQLIYIPSAHIYHKSWGTARKLPIEFINFHSFKNRISSLIFNLGSLNLSLILPVHLSICLLLIVYYFVQGKAGISLAIIRAFVWNLKHIDKILYKRKLVQHKIRKVSDTNLFPYILKTAGIKYYIFILKYSLIRSILFKK